MEAYKRVEWSVAILSSREPPNVLKGTIIAAVKACANKSAVIDVIVNGNEPLAATAAEIVSTLEVQPRTVTLRVWSIFLGDKAHAWNQHVYQMEPHASIVFYVDGYASVMPDAFTLLASSLRDLSSGLAATGVPTHGRSASKLRAQMLTEGGIHGNLFAIRGSVMDDLRRIQFRLPLGIYRTDPLIRAVLCFKMQPDQNTWDPGRVLVHPGATWRIPERKTNVISEIKKYFKRRGRQARGLLENAAVKQHLAVHRYPPQDLPELADNLIVTWAKSSRRDMIFLCLRNWSCIPAFVAACKTRDIPVDQSTRMLVETGTVGDPASE